MGQYWYIINVDTREHLGCWGKLGEFYGATAEYTSIASLLAGPWKGCRIMCAGDYMQECPPDVLTPEEVVEIENLPD